MTNFKLCTKEQEKLQDWLKTHKCEKSQTLETADCFLTSNYEVCFRPSGVGTGITIECDCGVREDITHWEHM